MAREVFRLWPALVILACGMARGASPSYSIAGIVSTASYAGPPFAPNSLVTVFGKSLAIATHTLSGGDIVDGRLPTEMNSTRVYVDNIEAPLLFVSEGQVNFLLSGKITAGPVPVRVVREGQTGPEVFVPIADAQPALFVSAGAAIATHGDGSLITADKPAAPGELIVVYATGLGKLQTTPQPVEIPHYSSPLANPGALKVMVGGRAVDAGRVLYAGLTPGCAGLYQINFRLPDDSLPDPELRVFIGDAGSQAGLPLPLR